MKTTIKTLARLATAVALCAATILPVVGVSHAAGPRPLTPAEFIGGNTGDLASSPGSVAGTKYTTGIDVASQGCGANTVFFNRQRYPGYNIFAATFGVADSSNSQIRLTVLGDDKQIFTTTKKQGELATRITVNLGKATVIKLTFENLLTTTCGFIAILANPVLFSSAAPGTTTPHVTIGGTITLKFLSATANPGGQQAALVVANKNASVGMIVDYPDGTQLLVGPKHAGADGHLVYTWTVPSGIHGTVHVTVDSAGKVVQGTFTVS